MSYSLFKEVTISNPGSETRYGSDDLLEIMKILNAKIVSNRRPEIVNAWRWSSWQEIKQVTEASVTTPADTNVVHLFLSATDNKLKVRKSGGTIINLEDVGSGTWSNSSSETITNKTMNVDANTFKHSTTNALGDILKHDGTRYSRFARGSANQVLSVNSAGTDLVWATVAGGGGGGEANTASNVGTAGIGVFSQKLGIDLQFKSLFSPDGSVNISDDTGNQKIDITLGGTLVKTTAANTYGDFQQTFRSGRLAVTNPANTFAYFFVGSALTASRSITLPLLAGNDVAVTEAFAQTLTNKTLSTGTIANTDAITLKHSTTNTAGELLVNNGTRFDRFAKGAPNTVLTTDASSNLIWGSGGGGGGGGVKLPDGTFAASTGRWGAFYGGAGNGMGMMGFGHQYNRIHGSSLSATESVTEIWTSPTNNAIAQFKTGAGFRRDSTCVFKAKWRLTSIAACAVKIGLSDATVLPAGGLGVENIRYDKVQDSAFHHEMDGVISRFGIRFDAAASGLGEIVSEVTIRFQKYGSPTGTATCTVRTNSGTVMATMGSFQPSSFSGTGNGVEFEAVLRPPTANTYVMQNGDRVALEFAPNNTDGIEMDQSTTAAAGYTSQQWDGSSWTNVPGGAGGTIAWQIKCTSVGSGTAGNAPLNAANGIMVHGTTGTHTNYQIARNNGAATQTVADSTKALSNLNTHDLTIDLNSTNVVVTLDGTAFTYTTVVPATTQAMAWFMQVESLSTSEKGLGIVSAQVVMAQ